MPSSRNCIIIAMVVATALAASAFARTGEIVTVDGVPHVRNTAEPHDGIFFTGNDRAVIVRGHVDAMMVQFTGGRMSIDLGEDEEAAMEVIVCRVKD